MASFYVLIDNSYSSTGLGSTNSPFNWTQLLSLIGTQNYTPNPSDTYLISGTRNLTADQNIYIRARVPTVGPVNTINLEGWNQTPWKILNPSYDINFYTSSTNIKIYDAMIQADYLSFFGPNISTAIGGIEFQNDYLKSNVLNIPYKNYVYFYAMTCKTNRLELFQTNQFITSRSIIDIPGFTTWTGLIASINYSTITTSSYMLNDIGIVTTNVQDNWVGTSALNLNISAVDTENFKHTNSNWSTVLNGLSAATNYRAWNGDTRDGIGALYFPTINASNYFVSASTSPGISANADEDIYFVVSGSDLTGNPYTDYGISAIKYQWNYPNTDVADIISYNNSILTHSYSATGRYYPKATLYSHNSWYSRPLTMEYLVIGSFNVIIKIYDRSAFSYQTFLIPPTNDLTDGITKPLTNLIISAVSDEIPPINYYWTIDGEVYEDPSYSFLEKAFNIEGTHNIVLNAYEGFYISQTSATILVSAVSAATYYVDLNSDYLVCAWNLGTSADPFNQYEFRGRLESVLEGSAEIQGNGEYGDIYKLKGEMLYPYPRYPTNYIISADPNKNFTIEDWDASIYGPWLMQYPNGTSYYGLNNISLVGCKLKNGIIYNEKNEYGHGGSIYLTNVYNMFIVNTGIDAEIIINPYNTLLSAYGDTRIVATSAYSNIIGSTIYFNNEDNYISSYWEDRFVSADYHDQAYYNLNIIDSVITGLRNLDQIYSDDDDINFEYCKLYIYNSVFDRSYLDLSEEFEISANVNSQYDWTPPTPYPFTSNHDFYNLYGKGIDYIIANKSLLLPFYGIQTPPNPGYNFSAYEGYEKGLFGELRVNYGDIDNFGHIGSFYFGQSTFIFTPDDDQIFRVSASFLTPNISSYNLIEYGTILPNLITVKAILLEPTIYSTENIYVDFVGVPRTGTSPLVVDFTATVNLGSDFKNRYRITKYKWYFDADCSTLPENEIPEETYVPTITKVFNGYAGQKYSVRLCVEVVQI